MLDAIRSYTGAIVLVTHDEGAVEALEPDRGLLLPDGVEDLWSADYADLVALGKRSRRQGSAWPPSNADPVEASLRSADRRERHHAR